LNVRTQRGAYVDTMQSQCIAYARLSWKADRQTETVLFSYQDVVLQR